MATTGASRLPETFSGRIWTFADCVFDDTRLDLWVGGNLVELELKPLEVLLQLLLNSGKMVAKEALLDAVWPGLMVVDGSLATAVSKLRKALGDSESKIVLTVPRVGYRMGVPVTSRPAAVGPVVAELQLEAGDAVPGREHWQFIRPLGEPQSKQVWLAENPKTREARVFKFASSDGRLRCLKREVTVSRYLHESLGERRDLVRLLEWNFETAPFSIESEYGGENLTQWAASQGGLGNIPLAVRLNLVADVATTVAAAHDAGVLHRDLKPANILVKPAPDGGWEIKVADFGSASLTEPGRLRALGITNLGMTQTCSLQNVSLSGTLLYLAPEVLAGSPPTAAADVYALGVMLYQIAAGDFHRPLSLGWEASIEDPVIREDIALAACGDPAKRLSSPADLAARLNRLATRRVERKLRVLKQQHDQLAERKQAEARVRRPWVIAACVALLAGVVASAALYRKVSSASAPPKGRTVAVLPFQNSSARNDFDFLQWALADEVATTLSHMRPLNIRPFSTATSRYLQPVADLQKAGRELAANSVVTGHYVLAGDGLQITMEAVNVEDNRLLWRDTVNVPAKSLLTLQAQVSAMTRGKLGPLLGAVLERNVSTAPPKNEDAYGLFLRSTSFAASGAPNQQALQMLESSVALDPTYAPAWAGIASRAYYSARFGGGGPAMMQRSDEAAERALALDPDYMDASAELILHDAERGKLAKSYREALDLVNRHPDNANAHHLLNYVLRYAGHLDEAKRQCEMAYLLDPIIWGSCGITFIESGDYKRAPNFMRMGHDTEWSKAINIEFYMRQGKTEVAASIGAPAIPHWDSYKMLLACAQHKPPSEIASLVPGAEADDDPEITYLFAGHLSYCGQSEEALHFLQTAVEANYCSYPAMDIDPMLANIRERPKFREIRAAGIACQKNFDAQRGTTPQ